MDSYNTSLCREEARLTYLIMKDKFSKVTYCGDHYAFRVHINDTTQFSVSIYPGNSGNMPCDGNTYPNLCYATSYSGVKSYTNGACN